MSRTYINVIKILHKNQHPLCWLHILSMLNYFASNNITIFNENKVFINQKIGRYFIIDGVLIKIFSQTMCGSYLLNSSPSTTNSGMRININSIKPAEILFKNLIFDFITQNYLKNVYLY